MGVFKMPSLGADMDSAKIVEWLVRPGDAVARGQVLAVVETQKGAIEIENFEAGTVERIDAAPGETLPVGAPLALIRTEGARGGAAAQEPTPGPGPEIPAVPPPETPGAPPPEQPDLPPQEAPGEQPQEVPDGPGPSEMPDMPPPEFSGGGLHEAEAVGPPASPAARRRASEAGVPLGAITGSGPGGAVLLADVEVHIAAAQTAQPPPARTARTARTVKPGLDMAEMRKAIAAAMVRSKREIPHYYLAHSIDLQPASDWLTATNAARPPDNRLLMGALLLKATATAAASAPALNGQFRNGVFTSSPAVHAGLVVALRGGGLIAPAILDAHLLALDDLMAAMRDLVERCRSGRLRNSEMTEGTITVSSMGETGAEALFGVIYPPQVALVGFGAPQRRAWVMEGAVVPRMVVTATLAADHRVSDGRLGARLLTEIDRLLKEPETL